MMWSPSPSRHRYLLSSKYGEVVNQMVTEVLLHHLIEKGVLDTQERDIVEATDGGITERACRLVALLDKKHDHTLLVFIQCLRDTHHEHVADLLEGEGTSEVEIRLEVTDSGQRFPRSLGDTVLQTFLTARSGTQTPSMRRKFGDQNKIQKTISECTEWLQKLCRLGCDLYEIKPGCVILVFKCQKRGLNFLWPGVTSGRFSRELTAIFQNSYSEMGPGVCQIDVGFNCIDMCATHNESNSATTSSGQPPKTSLVYTPTECAGPSADRNLSGVDMSGPGGGQPVSTATTPRREAPRTASKSKDTSLLDRFDREHLKEPSPVRHPAAGHLAPDHPRRITPTGGWGKRLKRAQEVVSELQDVLRRATAHNNIKCLDSWSSTASSLASETSLPPYTIGVVGESGHGKTSLLNSLINHTDTDILPTSGSTACTAVVIEVGDNGAQPVYEARIDFISVEDWKNELKALLGTLETQSGGICCSRPDSRQSPEAYVAWCKVRAVYGKFSSSTTLEDLMKPNEVTKHLGKPIDIEEEEVDTFCDSIDKYVKGSGNSDDGGEFWPLVKKVSIRIPGCKMCQDGIVLVDLPGSGDSNAARDIIAQENMKKLSHVLIVAEITRAVTSKTAKDLLGQQFRRQMLMDGQYRNITLICTKSDIIGTPNEIERDLKNKQRDLRDKMQPDKTAIQNLRSAKGDLDKKKKSKENEVKDIEKEEKQLKGELKDIEKHRSDLEGVQFSEPELKARDAMVSRLEQKRKRVESELERVQNQLTPIQKEMNGYKEEISSKSTEIHKHQKSLALIGAKARNKFVCEEIHNDFRCGIEEMKTQAGDQSKDDVDQIAQTLTVFCVSSMDYKKITHEVEAPQVYREAADTEIPRLREFLQELGEEPKRQRTEELLHCLYQLLSDIKGRLNDSGIEDFDLRWRLSTHIEVEQRKGLHDGLQQLIQTYSDYLQTLIDSLLYKLKDGTKEGKERALNICRKWGRQPDTKNRNAGGLSVNTYKAVCRHGGVYKSTAVGNINFNEDLSAPLFTELCIAWDRAFNVKLQSLPKAFIGDMRAEIKKFIKHLQEVFPGEESRLARFGEQVALTLEIKIAHHMDDVKTVVQRQRDISRRIIPIIKEEMRETYSKVGEQTGKGSFDRMKAIMEEGVKVAAYRMYDKAATRVENELLVLQTDIVQCVMAAVESLLSELQTVCEPPWESQKNVDILKTVLDERVDRLLVRVQDMCKEANVNPGQQRTATQMTPMSRQRKRRPSTSQGPPENQEPPEKIKPGNRQHFTGHSDLDPIVL